MNKPKKTTRHGLHGLMRRVSTKGLAALDRRSAGYRAVKEWRRELEVDLGGSDHLSSQERTLVEQATRLRLYIDVIDEWAMRQESLINKRNRSIAPILRERMQLVDGLVRILGLLGLKRREVESGVLPAAWVEKVMPPNETEEEKNAEPDPAAI